MGPVLILLATIVLAYLGTMLSTSRMSGWKAASEHWPLPPGREPGRRLSTSRLNLVRMNWLLKVGFHADGLSLTLPRVFRPGLANILVPWEAVKEIREIMGLFGPQALVDIPQFGTLIGPPWLTEAWVDFGSPRGEFTDDTGDAMTMDSTPRPSHPEAEKRADRLAERRKRKGRKE